MVEGQLLPQSVFALAQCADPSPNCRDMLTDGEIEALHKRRTLLLDSGVLDFHAVHKSPLIYKVIEKEGL